MAEKQNLKGKFSTNLLNDQQKEDFLFVQKRVQQLQLSRVNHYGVNLDDLWSDADKDYIPHRLKTKGRRLVPTDETKGWRGQQQIVGSEDWQSDTYQSNPFIKIQTALSILVDQNPSGVFTPTSKKYEATTEIIRQLYQRSWEYAKSKQQLKLFVFNIAKYGWAIARTYPLRITRKVKVLIEIDTEDPSKNKYETKEVVEYNDIFRENVDPRNAWIDDMAKPNNPFTLRDWCWRKVYDMQSAEDEFGKYKNWKYVQQGGTVTETIQAQKKSAYKEFKTEDLVEVVFYENRLKDLFMVVANGVPLVIEPLPVSDANGVKKLSCWQSYWQLRHGESPYGVGIYEAIRFDQALLDRFRNMSIDQLTLSIYKMFFYTGTDTLTDTGDIRIRPGVGKQVLNPKDIKWLEVPGPGREAVEWLDRLRKDVDEGSGIGDPLLGIVTGKTAFEIAQAKEGALKRLKTPLENILDALDTEGYITISLIQLLYSIPETYKITDPELINDYLQEIEGDSDLYERDEEGGFTAKLFPEFPLNLEEDQKGNLIETESTRFFRVKPRLLQWEGIINIESQSILSTSRQVEKALNLEMYNILIPLLSNDPLLYAKVAKDIVKMYDKDPRDILPDLWLQEPKEMQAQMQAAQPLIIPQEQANVAQEAQTIVPRTQGAASPQSLIGQITSRLTRPFRV